MKVIGITGGVGAGKSQVLSWLSQVDKARIIEADQVGHLVLKKGQACYEPALKIFGDSIVGADGELDRGLMGQRAFEDPALLDRLSQVVHPAVRKFIEEALVAGEKEGCRYFFLESAILLEAGYQSVCDEIWYIYASVPTRARRLAKSRHYSREKIQAMMAKQMDEAGFRAVCHKVIDNDGEFEETAEQMRKILGKGQEI